MDQYERYAKSIAIPANVNASSLSTYANHTEAGRISNASRVIDGANDIITSQLVFDSSALVQPRDNVIPDVTSDQDANGWFFFKVPTVEFADAVDSSNRADDTVIDVPRGVNVGTLINITADDIITPVPIPFQTTGNFLVVDPDADDAASVFVRPGVLAGKTVRLEILEIRQSAIGWGAVPKNNPDRSVPISRHLLTYYASAISTPSIGNPNDFSVIMTPTSTGGRFSMVKPLQSFSKQSVRQTYTRLLTMRFINREGLPIFWPPYSIPCDLRRGEEIQGGNVQRYHFTVEVFDNIIDVTRQPVHLQVGDLVSIRGFSPNSGKLDSDAMGYLQSNQLVISSITAGSYSRILSFSPSIAITSNFPLSGKHRLYILRNRMQIPLTFTSYDPKVSEFVSNMANASA